jgi:tripartite-type tricarboxylate transporter receptor subunit TctC
MSFATKAVAAAVAVAASAALVASAHAQAQYPTRATNYVIPFAPGGESDITARFQQPYWKEFTGQDLVIQYRPGAGGAQAWAQLNRETPDGYTLVGVNLPHIVLQPMQSDVGYKTEDLVPVHMFHYTPDAIVVRAESPYRTLQDLIDDAKRRPGAVTMAGSATFSANHAAHQIFNKQAGIRTTYVPFSGTAPSTAALLGGQVAASMGYTTVAAAQGERVRMLAVAMERRHPAFPDVPTFRELGIDMVGGAYRGIAVPKDTPEAVRRQVSALVQRINDDPRFRKQMEDGGFVVTDVGYERMADFMAERRREIEGVAAEMR